MDSFFQAQHHHALSRFEEVLTFDDDPKATATHSNFNEHSNPPVISTKVHNHVLDNSQQDKLEKRRKNQLNYRQRKGQMIKTLEKECNEIKQQNDQFEQLRALTVSLMLSRQSNFHQHICTTAVKYFDIMVNGISLTSGPTKDRQIGFLRSVFEEDLQLDGGFAGQHGVNGLIDQFVKYTKFHKSIKLGVWDFTVCGDTNLAIVRNKLETTLVISRESIAAIYPHILGNETLVQRMIGKTIVVPGTTMFYFNKHGHVEKFDCNIDYVQAWESVLKDLDDVVYVLDDAKISGCYIAAPLDD